MADILSRLLAFPPNPPPARPLSDSAYDSQIRQLLEVLRSASPTKLTSNIPGGGDLLDVSLPLQDKVRCLISSADTRSFGAVASISMGSAGKGDGQDHDDGQRQRRVDIKPSMVEHAALS